MCETSRKSKNADTCNDKWIYLKSTQDLPKKKQTKKYSEPFDSTVDTDRLKMKAICRRNMDSTCELNLCGKRLHKGYIFTEMYSFWICGNCCIQSTDLRIKLKWDNFMVEFSVPAFILSFHPPEIFLWAPADFFVPFIYSFLSSHIFISKMCFEDFMYSGKSKGKRHRNSLSEVLHFAYYTSEEKEQFIAYCKHLYFGNYEQVFGPHETSVQRRLCNDCLLHFNFSRSKFGKEWIFCAVNSMLTNFRRPVLYSREFPKLKLNCIANVWAIYFAFVFWASTKRWRQKMWHPAKVGIHWKFTIAQSVKVIKIHILYEFYGYFGKLTHFTCKHVTWDQPSHSQISSHFEHQHMKFIKKPYDV